MIRRVIHIDEAACNGCGICVKACHEGAIGLVDGKARLMRDDYCDGLGDCLPACPTGAITFVEREAAAYDEAAVLANKAKRPHQRLLRPAVAPVRACRCCVLLASRPDAPARARNLSSMPRLRRPTRAAPVRNLVVAA